MTSAKTTTRLLSAGFSLIEVLVALAVLSIGLLGLAALQVTSIRFNHQSYQRTQATVLIYEVIDRMRANPNGLANYVIAIGAATPSFTQDCATNTCTPAQLATYDLNKWRNSILAAIGSQASAIAQNGSQYTITIQWTEQDLQQTQNLTVQL